MPTVTNISDISASPPRVHFAEKLARSLSLIHAAYQQFGNRLVVEHNLTRESCVVWDLAKRVSPGIEGFCVATRFQNPEARQFVKEIVARYPEISVYESHLRAPDELPLIDPHLCCEILRYQPKRQALEELRVACLVTGFRHARGLARFDLNEFQKVTGDLCELTPILAWDEEDVSQYIASRQIPLIPLHEQGPRAFACSACANTLMKRECSSGRTVVGTKSAAFA